MDFTNSISRGVVKMKHTMALKKVLLTYDLHDTLDPQAIISDMERYATTKELFDFNVQDLGSVGHTEEGVPLHDERFTCKASNMPKYDTCSLPKTEGKTTKELLACNGTASVVKVEDTELRNTAAVLCDSTSGVKQEPMEAGDLLGCEPSHDTQNMVVDSTSAMKEEERLKTKNVDTPTGVPIVERGDASHDIEMMINVPTCGFKAGNLHASNMRDPFDPHCEQTQFDVTIPTNAVEEDRLPLPSNAGHKPETEDGGLDTAGPAPSRTNAGVGVPGPTSEVAQSVSLECPACRQMFGDRQMLGVHLRRVHARFACKICDKKCSSYIALLVHKHNAGHARQCELCGKIVATRKKLVAHRRWCRLPRFECKLCATVERSHGRLFDHYRVVHSKIKCGVCDALFSSKQSAKKHEEYHDVSTTACLICMEIMRSEKKLKTHYYNVHTKLKCPYCALTLHAERSLAEHNARCVVKNSCTSCRRHFGTGRELERHNQLVHAIYWCETCRLQLHLPGGLGAHRRNAHAKVQSTLPAERVEKREAEKRKDAVESRDATSKRNEEVGGGFLPNLDTLDELRVHDETHAAGRGGLKRKISSAENPATSDDPVPSGGNVTVARVFLCDACGGLFDTSADLEAHERTHVGSSHSCKSCSLTFGTSEELATHEKAHAVAHRCRLCSLTFGSSEEVAIHERGHVAHCCNFCSLMFGTSEELAIHEKAHATHPCKSCSLTFGTSEQLVTHERMHYTHHCKFCSLMFNTSEELTVHERTHVTHRCKFCGLTFDTLAELGVHENTHLKYQCRFCSLVFDTTEEFVVHENSHVKYCCRFCSVLLDTPDEVVTHENSHVKYQCRFCAILFDTSEALALHEALHVKYQCRFCAVLFDTSEESALHEKSHFKYQCRFCGSLFDTAEESATHENTHLKYQCRFCALICDTLEELVIHENSHVKYQCRFCSLLLNTSEEFATHELSHVTVHQCKFCNSFQGTLESLQIHESSQHRKVRIARK